MSTTPMTPVKNEPARTVPVLQQTLKMHLNGGKKFSTLMHTILADGKDTGITRICQTSGRPKYLKLSEKLIKGTEEFDILATRGVGMEEWILAHLGDANAPHVP